jgi:hypothetical protein
MGAELFHADGQTDLTKLIAAFRNFTKALKNVKYLYMLYKNAYWSTRRAPIILDMK